MDMKAKVAQTLLDIQAVSLSPEKPFTWTSGLRSPIYCDNRMIMSFPKERRTIEEGLADLIKQEFPDVEVIAGTATAGIPHAAYVSDILGLPMIYVRSSAKAHGKQSAIEGKLDSGAKVVMIEDLISTGGSVIHAADLVEAAGGQVLGCVAIFNYLLQVGKDNFERSGYKLATLTDYQALVSYAVGLDEYKAHQEALEQWHHDPQAWSQAHGQ
ncbi:orotate phosphoribosyltransferase [Hutsoniella sourekii]|uniref:orotate phosphoribosyltransferase n=1 Tax=Hutsoniella sourekii TaxID=87650 RepID=UPI0004846377|nr:orotate phosphoribosyltransferase [Hutsoniella sourekii]